MPSDDGVATPALVRSRRRPRAGAVALALVLLLLSGAVVAVLVNTRTIEGGVPGTGGLLSVAVTDAGFFVGTTAGAYASPDGREWRRVDALPRAGTLARRGDGVVAASGRELLASTDLESFERLAVLPSIPTALAPAADGTVYAIDRSGRLHRAAAGSEPSRVGAPGPPSSLGLAVKGEAPVVYAASLGAGMWRSEDGGRRWARLLATPSQAVLVDPEAADRIMLGTPGGLLVSRDGGASWGLSRLQVPIRGLAWHAGRFFALTGDRLLLVSREGEGSWEPVAPAKALRRGPRHEAGGAVGSCLTAGCSM